ncbi:hypothetical protein [Actinotalea solisilvae]|uniref:hypothetical protein n=1 Tax=Actinotalea solisilvae TaxID=2072922 RepID=UPI0018F1D3F9|nr:hypothetical protein [Actinotalea solisilvae]
MDRTAPTTGALARPVAPRLRRPGWRDPRLLVGLVLVAGSVALGGWAVGAAARTVPVYVAVGSLVPGQALDEASLAVREVRLDASTDAYLSAADPLPAGLVVQRTVADGELVPRSALGEVDALEVRPVAVPVEGVLPSGLVAGAVVDLWFVPEVGASPTATATTGATSGSPDDPAAPPQPVALAEALTVAEVGEADGAFAVGGTTTVHVLVPLDRLTTVLAATAAEGELQVVVVPGLGSS